MQLGRPLVLYGGQYKEESRTSHTLLLSTSVSLFVRFLGTPGKQQRETSTTLCSYFCPHWSLPYSCDQPRVSCRFFLWAWTLHTPSSCGHRLYPQRGSRCLVRSRRSNNASRGKEGRRESVTFGLPEKKGCLLSASPFGVPLCR